MQWQNRSAGTHHDRECAPLRVCSPGEYESKAAEKQSNRECADCAKGHKCDGSDVQTPCAAASRQYQDETAKATCKVCEACPAGEIRKGCGGNSPGDCYRCPVGQRKTSEYTCEACKAGTYEMDRTTCADCKAGRYSVDEAERCVSCAHGQYQPAARAKGCIVCSTGFTSDEGRRSHGTSMVRVISSMHYRTCSQNQCANGSANTTSNRECEDWRVCHNDESALKRPTGGTAPILSSSLKHRVRTRTGSARSMPLAILMAR